MAGAGGGAAGAGGGAAGAAGGAARWRAAPLGARLRGRRSRRRSRQRRVIAEAGRGRVRWLWSRSRCGAPSRLGCGSRSLRRRRLDPIRGPSYTTLARDRAVRRCRRPGSDGGRGRLRADVLALVRRRRQAPLGAAAARDAASTRPTWTTGCFRSAPSSGKSSRSAACCWRRASSSATARVRRTTGWGRSSGTPTETEAVFAPDGAEQHQRDARTTPRAEAVPAPATAATPAACSGFSAIQLSRAGGDTPASGRRSPDLDGARASSPRRPRGGRPRRLHGARRCGRRAAALGYLHANCGHCHNQNGTSWPDTQMVLRLGPRRPTWRRASSISRWSARSSSTGAAVSSPDRVVPGSPDSSAVVARMSMRGSDDQMPPLATEETDPTGLEKVRAWIAALPPRTPMATPDP